MHSQSQRGSIIGRHCGLIRHGICRDSKPSKKYTRGPIKPSNSTLLLHKSFLASYVAEKSLVLILETLHDLCICFGQTETDAQEVPDVAGRLSIDGSWHMLMSITRVEHPEISIPRMHSGLDLKTCRRTNGTGWVTLGLVLHEQGFFMQLPIIKHLSMLYVLWLGLAGSTASLKS